MEDCQRRLSDYYNYEKNGAKWKDELQKSKNNFRKTQGKLLRDCWIEKKRMRSRNLLIKKLRLSLRNFGAQ